MYSSSRLICKINNLLILNFVKKIFFHNTLIHKSFNLYNICLKIKDIIRPSDILLNSFVKNIQKSNNDIPYLKACEEIANEILSLDVIKYSK